MWLFTRYGFYSIASARTPDGSIDPEKIMVRARLVAHLKNLRKRFPDVPADILTWPNRDYRFRLIVAKEVWIRIVAELTREQEWSNFKNEAARHQGTGSQAYVHALHRVWSVMSDLQQAEPRD